MCMKGKAAPELVYNPDRLNYPLKRTRPKGAAEPGWRQVSWDEALDDIAGPRTGHAKLRYECAQAARLATGRRRSSEELGLYFEIYYRLAAPARYSATYGAGVRDEVEAAAGHLRQAGAAALAEELVGLLEPGI